MLFRTCAQVARLVVRLPQLFSFKPDENIEDTARCVVCVLSIAKGEIPRLIGILCPVNFFAFIFGVINQYPVRAWASA